MSAQFNWSQRELDWIEKNSNLIEDYPNNKNELHRSLIATFSYGIDYYRLAALIHYVKFGAKGFRIDDDNAGGIRVRVRLYAVDGGWTCPIQNATISYDGELWDEVYSEAVVRKRFKDFLFLGNSFLPHEIAADIIDHCDLHDELYLSGRVNLPTRKVANYNGEMAP